MEKPYLNQIQRFIISRDTLSGALLMLDLKWKIFLRNLKDIVFFGRWLDNF